MVRPAIAVGVGPVCANEDETFSLFSRVRGALGEISCIRASLAFNQMDLARVKELSRQAQTYLTDGVPGGIFNERLSLRAIAAFNLAMAYKYGGETNEAVAAFEVANRLLREDENHHLLPMSISYLADLYALRGKLHLPALTTAFHVLIVGAIIALTGVPFFDGLAPTDWGGFVLVTLLAVLSCTGIGALVGVVAGDARSVVLLSQLICLPSMLLAVMIAQI